MLKFKLNKNEGVQTMDSSQHRDLLANIAQDYYLTKLPISEISQKYNLSRYLISKYLEEALSTDLVSITINSELARNGELEYKLHELFEIDHLTVLKDPVNPDQRENTINVVAAKQMQTIINSSHVIGLTWGDTIFRVIDHFVSETRPDLIFTQFIGENMKYNSSAGSMRMVQKAGAKYDAPYQTIVGPLYVLNDHTRHALTQEPALLSAFNTANRMDLLLSGVGTLASVDSIPVWHNHKAEIFPGINENQIAGLVFGRPYDIDGNFLNIGSDKTFGIPLNTVLSVPRRFGVVQSKFKARATLGALRGKLFTDLVMDESVALRILAENKKAD